MTMNHEWRIALIVNPALPLGEISNTVAVLSVGIGAACPFLAGKRLCDGAELGFHSCANRPVPVLAADHDRLCEIATKVFEASADYVVVPFPRFARSVHSFDAYEADLRQRRIVDEPLDGLALAGPGKFIRSLTGSLKLLR